MHSSLARVDHRPWPLPSGPWVLRQRWRNLLFAHWPVAAARLRHLVPAGLAIEEFDGTSWAGIVPFRIEDLTWRFLPSLPYFSSFPEINLRLYVERGGKSGVWFISLDADNAAAVFGARAAFQLPYWRAAIDMNTRGDRTRYRSVRRSPRLRSAERRSGQAQPTVRFDAEYRPTSDPTEPQAGTLEHFLTERYCLYAPGRGGSLKRLEIHHAPWALQLAEADIRESTLASTQGISLDEGLRPLLHFSRQQDVVAWWPTRA